MEFFVPPDNLEMRKLYEPKKGCCCPAAIGAYVHRSVREIIGLWPNKYRGYAPLKETEAMLKKLKLNPVWKKGGKSKIFPKPLTGAAIVRIAWLKDDGTEPYWMGAPSHLVLLQKDSFDNSWWVFCNAHEWCKIDREWESEYLKYGYVSSYFEIEAKNGI